MTDREKVLYELKHQVADADWCNNEWKDNVPIWMLRGAYELLKAQEPRLLTLDKVIAHYSLPPVFVDDLGMQEDYYMDIKPLYFDFPDSDELSFAEHWRGYSQVRQYLDDWKASYGEKWVCWTDKPTDEQRKAVKRDEQAGRY